MESGPSGGALYGNRRRERDERSRQCHRADSHQSRDLYASGFEPESDVGHHDIGHGDAARGFTIYRLERAAVECHGRSPFGLTVTALDTFNNVATGFNNSVTIALAQTRERELWAQLQAISWSSRRAVAWRRFAGLLLDIVGSPYTISASSTGVASAALSTPISVTPAAATKLVIYIPPPTTMTSGSQFGLATEASTRSEISRPGIPAW